MWNRSVKACLVIPAYRALGELEDSIGRDRLSCSWDRMLVCPQVGGQISKVRVPDKQRFPKCVSQHVWILTGLKPHGLLIWDQICVASLSKTGKRKSEWDRPPAGEVGWSHFKPERRGRMEMTWGSSSRQPIPLKKEEAQKYCSFGSSLLRCYWNLFRFSSQMQQSCCILGHCGKRDCPVTTETTVCVTNTRV